MKHLFRGLLVAALLTACGQEQPKPGAGTLKKKPVTDHIGILPFTGVDTALLSGLREDLARETGLRVTLLKSQELPEFAYYPPRNRYTADSLLVFLKTFSGPDESKIIGVTSSDISTPLRGSPSWGVMGLAVSPGPCCVISSFRAKKGVRNAAHLRERMRILALHELGHTIGLPHCTKECLMKDAGGKMNLDDARDYCPDCFSFLQKNGFIRRRE